MIVIGIDSHKSSHTAVAADELGRQVATRTVAATSAGHAELLGWAARFSERRFAIEDCRSFGRRLAADLLGAGEAVVWVPPKLMARARRSGREPGKSDPIDALAVARAALREPALPLARLEGPERELRLLVDHRDDLVAERTRWVNRLRGHLHELEPGSEPPPRSLDRARVVADLEVRLATREGSVARLARAILARIASLTAEIDALEGEIAGLVGPRAPSLLALPGCGPLTAAKIVAETAGIGRFRSAAAFARWTGTAPLEVSSGRTVRHRLNRTGNRQLNAALHRIAITQLRLGGPGRTYVERRRAGGKTVREALRALKRHLASEVFRCLRADADRALSADRVDGVAA